MKWLALLATSAVMAAPGAAQAHSAFGKASGFVDGFRHPLSGADHLLAMVAVGLWGAFLGRPLIAALPVIFPALMALGALAGLYGAPLPSVELGVAASLVGLGLAVGLAMKTPPWAACVVVGVFGLFHGYAHGRELPESADPGAYCTGFVLATGLLHAAGIGLGEARRLPDGETAIRALGFLMSAAGALFLQRAVAS